MEFEGEINPDALIACTLHVSGADAETSNMDSHSFPAALALNAWLILIANQSSGKAAETGFCVQASLPGTPSPAPVNELASGSIGPPVGLSPSAQEHSASGTPLLEKPAFLHFMDQHWLIFWVSRP